MASKSANILARVEPEVKEQAAVCDDDRQFAAKLEEMVRQEAEKMQLAVETETYFDGDTLIADIGKGYRYELMFLDIEMTGVNGINAAHAIRERPFRAAHLCVGV